NAAPRAPIGARGPRCAAMGAAVAGSADDGRHVAAVHELEGGVDAEVRLAGASLGLEEIEVVALTHGEPDLVGDRVELHLRAEGAVDPTQVDHQTIVDEDEDVVVPREPEHLAALVAELRVDLGREVEVVLTPLVAEARVVHREERVAVEGVDVVVRLEVDVEPVGAIDVLDGVVPFGELVGARRHVRAPCVGVHGLLVGAEHLLDESFPLTAAVALEVVVVVTEVADDADDRRAATRAVRSRRVIRELGGLVGARLDGGAQEVAAEDAGGGAVGEGPGPGGAVRAAGSAAGRGIDDDQTSDAIAPAAAVAGRRAARAGSRAASASVRILRRAGASAMKEQRPRGEQGRPSTPSDPKVRLAASRDHDRLFTIGGQHKWDRRCLSGSISFGTTCGASSIQGPPLLTTR